MPYVMTTHHLSKRYGNKVALQDLNLQLPAGKIIGLDKNFALEMVTGGGVLVEYDKLIDRQLERAAITSISGFGKICADAAKVLNV